MKLFIGLDEYGSVYVYTSKEQYHFEHQPLFKYNDFMALAISYDDAVKRSNDVFTAYELTKHNSGLCTGPMVKEEMITK